MSYFGGAGVQGDLHPSLRAYIDCFKSKPLPVMYPRGGGPWDQDPFLMRDFRIIRDHEVRWQQTQEQMQQMTSGKSPEEIEREGGGGGGLGQSLEEYLEELGEDGHF